MNTETNFTTLDLAQLANVTGGTALPWPEDYQPPKQPCDWPTCMPPQTQPLGR